MIPGLIEPSTNFAAVRDGRNSQVFYVDIALDNARTVGGSGVNAAIVLNISGNSFYCDANPSDGNCFVHFQDTNFDRGPVPLYVSPGVIFNIPYTQVLIENTAQPGKKVRIAYGIDVDFQPGSVAQIAVTNNGGYTAVRPESPTGFFNSVASLAAGTAETVFTAAANTGGAIILGAHISVYESTPIVHNAGYLAKATAPTTTSDSAADPILMTQQITVASAFVASANLPIAQFVPAGKGLFYIDEIATPVNGQTRRNCRYRLL